MPEPQSRRPDPRSDRLVHVALALVVALIMAPFAASAWADADHQALPATEEEADPSADTSVEDEMLAMGSQVYSQSCQACHQPGGVGITGQFPPLVDNPNVQDRAYLVDVIGNGVEGEIEVLGTTYDGRMPAFSTLATDEVDALVFYIQSGFASPSIPEPAAGSATTDRGLPGLASFTYIVALLIAVAVGLLVLAPRLTSASDRLHMPWLDAWLKTGVIVVGFVLFTVFVPNWALQTETVGKLDRSVQDLVGAGLWILGLGGGIWAVWYAQRTERI